MEHAGLEPTLDAPGYQTGSSAPRKDWTVHLGLDPDEARPVLDDMRRVAAEPLSRRWIDYLAAWLDRRPADMAIDPALLNSLKILDDPEAIFQDGWLLCEAGDYERGLKSLARAVHAGYYAATTLSSSRHFDAVRDDPAFRSLLAEAEAGRRLALETLRAERGERLLGATAGRG